MCLFLNTQSTEVYPTCVGMNRFLPIYPFVLTGLSHASGNVSGGNVKIARFSVTFHASGNDSNTLRAIAVIFPFVPHAWE